MTFNQLEQIRSILKQTTSILIDGCFEKRDFITLCEYALDTSGPKPVIESVQHYLEELQDSQTQQNDTPFLISSQMLPSSVTNHFSPDIIYAGSSREDLRMLQIEKKKFENQSNNISMKISHLALDIFLIILEDKIAEIEASPEKNLLTEMFLELRLYHMERPILCGLFMQENILITLRHEQQKMILKNQSWEVMQQTILLSRLNSNLHSLQAQERYILILTAFFILSCLASVMFLSIKLLLATSILVVPIILGIISFCFVMLYPILNNQWFSIHQTRQQIARLATNLNKSNIETYMEIQDNIVVSTLSMRDTCQKQVKIVSHLCKATLFARRIGDDQTSEQASRTPTIEKMGSNEPAETGISNPSKGF